MTVSMKIAEGCGREGIEFGRCLQHARATAVELEYLLLLGYDLHLIEEPPYEALQTQLIEVRKMLSGLMKMLPV
jgi:four helix bundle protein